MPQSVRDQIMTQIQDAKTSAERTMLLLMLQIYDLWAENTETLGKVADSVDELNKAHHGIPPDRHRVHHGWAEERFNDDIDWKDDARKIRTSIIEKGLLAFLVFIAGAVVSKVFGA